MNERLRILREFLGLNQLQFSKRTNISRSMVAMFETGDREMKDIHISQICHAFNVNETWLRTGTGEMYAIPDSTLVSQLAREYNLDSLDQSIVEAYIQLPAEYRKGLKVYLSSLMEKFQAIEGNDGDLDEETIDNSELMEQARQMIAKAKMQNQPPADQSAKKNA